MKQKQSPSCLNTSSSHTKPLLKAGNPSISPYSMQQSSTNSHSQLPSMVLQETSLRALKDVRSMQCCRKQRGCCCKSFSLYSIFCMQQSGKGVSQDWGKCANAAPPPPPPATSGLQACLRQPVITTNRTAMRSAKVQVFHCLSQAFIQPLRPQQCSAWLGLQAVMFLYEQDAVLC